MIAETTQEWPPRPTGEMFPPLLDTVLVGQLLLYDRRPGMTVEQTRRNVRKLVHGSGLPTLGRIGSTLMFDRDAVLIWLGSRNGSLDRGDGGSTVDDA